LRVATFAITDFAAATRVRIRLNLAVLSKKAVGYIPYILEDYEAVSESRVNGVDRTGWISFTERPNLACPFFLRGYAFYLQPLRFSHL
jgi:hypothetical protein